MLKQISLTLLIGVISISIAFAQKTGVITFKCTNVEGGGMPAMMLSNSTQTIAFGKSTTLLNFNAMNGSISTKIYTNYTSNNTTLLMSLPFMGKFKVKMTEEEAKAYQGKVIDMKVIYDKKTTKKILGYTCYKATIKTKLGSTILFVTDKIKPKHTPFETMFPTLKGFPLEFQSNRNGTNLTFLAEKVAKINNNTFKIPKDGYEELTPEEFKKKMGGFKK